MMRLIALLRAFYNRIPRWALRPFRWIFKSSVFLALMAYIFVGGLAFGVALDRFIYSRQPLDAFESFVDAQLESGHPERIAGWIAARPQAETEALLPRVIARAGEFDAPVFFELMRRELRRDKKEEALFWLQYGSFRLRFDMVRCWADIEDIQRFNSFIKSAPSPRVLMSYQNKTPHALKDALTRVLAFDKDHPANNDPARICKALNKSQPYDKSAWNTWREAVRNKTQGFIDSGAQPAPLTPAPHALQPGRKKP